MEIEYFVRPDTWREQFDLLEAAQREFIVRDLGLTESKIHRIEVPDADRAHYSKFSIDTEFDFPFGQKELLGLAYRTDHDLSAHTKASTVDLSYFDEETKERFVPHVIEPTFGLGRLLLAVISDAYAEDEQNGEVRTYLKFKPSVAPVKAAVFPLLKNKPELVAKAREVYLALKKDIPQIMWDDNGNVDFDTLGENPELLNTVTVRDRDTGAQTRVAISELAGMLTAKIKVE
jgi:glycyl-tRNA synthetase